MLTIITAFLLVQILSFIGRYSKGQARTVCTNKNKIVYYDGNNKIYWALFWILAGIAGFRKGFVDTNSYRNIYETVGTDFSMVTDDNLRVEKGFRFICYLLNHISKNSQLLLFVVAIFVTFSFFKFIDRYSINRWFSVTIFFLTIYLTTMNTMRQYIVVGVLLLSLPLLNKGKWWLFVLISLLLTLVHSTAIFAALAILLSRGEFLNRRMLIVIGCTIVFVFTPADSFLSMLQTANIQDYAEMYEVLNKGGVNILRLAVQVVPVILAAIYFHMYGRENLNSEYSMFANLSVLNLIAYIFSTKSNYLARIAVYFEVFNLIMIPFFISKIIRDDQVRVMNAIAVVLYSIYFYYVIRGFGTYSVDLLNPYFFGG